ncbi:hypothetical protein QO206_05670 [Leeuwenhoekiella aequorea]|uniref:hypothetical protein n=1 Tax=Leeuwenhoekiella aequorea TaxID=283736 RepID=UPI00352CB372|tara:strand:- start:27877 stop:28512 length:636 start_codon:yes stop_codon:yes gene_type:complete
MEQTLEELSRLLSLLYNVWYYNEREFGSEHANFYSYPSSVFDHNSNGYPIVERLVDIEFQSTYSNARKENVGFPNQFDKGNCAIIEEHKIYFHRSISQTLFCYLGLLLREDLEIAYEYFNSPIFLQNNIGSRIEDGCLLYSVMTQEQVWQGLSPHLTYANYTFFFLYRLSQYGGFNTGNIMEFKLDSLRRFIDVHLSDYNFETFNENLILE